MLAAWKIAAIVISVIVVVGLALGLGLGLGLKSKSTTPSPISTVTPTITVTPTPSPVPAIINSTYTYVPYNVGLVESFCMIINRDTSVPVRSIALGDNHLPFNIVVAPNLKTAYILNVGTNDISILDITNPDTVTTISGTIDLTTALPSAAPFCGIITPDGKWLFVGTAGITGKVIQIQLSDNTVKRVIDNAPDFYNLQSIVVNPEGTMLYVSNETTARGFVPIDISDPETPVVKPKVVVPTIGSQELNNLVITSDGLFLYMIPNNIVDPNVYQYDIKTETLNESTNTITGGVDINRIGISPDNKTLYAVSNGTNPGACNLFTIDIAANYASTFIPMYVPTTTDVSASVQATSDMILTTASNISAIDGRINRFNTSSVPLVPPITTPIGALFQVASPFLIFGQT